MKYSTKHSFRKNTPIGTLSTLVLTLLLTLIPPNTQAENKVKITPDLAFLDVQHAGKTIRIEWNQDTKNKLSNSFTKTS